MTNLNFNKIFVSFFSKRNGVAMTIALVNMIDWLTYGHFKAVKLLHKALAEFIPLSPEWKAAKDKMKAGLECWTPSCVIREDMTRSDANIERMSGIMAFDFDLKDQLDPDFFLKEFKGSMGLFPSVLYAGLSASGQGFFALVLTDSDDPQRFKPTYKKMAEEFSKVGWITDPQASSLSNYRFVSYDPEPYLNYDAEPYKSVEPEAVCANFNAAAAKKPYEAPTFEQLSDEEEYQKIENLIKTHGCPASSDRHEDWVKVGFAFVNRFGEQGRELFHLYSALSPKYKAAECDRKYTNLLRTTKGTVTIASFYYLVSG